MYSIIGDFNGRTEKERGVGLEEIVKKWGRKRRESNSKTNKGGRMLVEFLEEKGWGIFNGSIKGVERKEYTFTGGKENTVIDYIIGNEEKRLVVED